MPQALGGADTPAKMQRQILAAKDKDRWATYG